MVNLARSAALCCTITTLICGLTSLLQLSGILLCINREAYRHNRQRCIEMLTFSSIRSRRVTKRKAKRRFWIRPGRTRVWWDNFLNDDLDSLLVPRSNDEAQRPENEIAGLDRFRVTLRNRVVFDAVSRS